jgi:hypothetical protein
MVLARRQTHIFAIVNLKALGYTQYNLKTNLTI